MTQTRPLFWSCTDHMTSKKCKFGSTHRPHELRNIGFGHHRDRMNYKILFLPSHRKLNVKLLPLASGTRSSCIHSRTVSTVLLAYDFIFHHCILWSPFVLNCVDLFSSAERLRFWPLLWLHASRVQNAQRHRL